MAIKRIGKGFEFDKTQAEYRKFKATAPKIIANNSHNHFLLGFRKGGRQTDDSKSGWAARENVDSGRAILVKTGALRDSLKIIKETFQEIIIGTTRILYADRHNEGLAGMPKREFVGDSKELNLANKNLLAKLLKKVFG